MRTGDEIGETGARTVAWRIISQGPSAKNSPKTARGLDAPPKFPIEWR